jgi:acetyltransferase-like isoleucine patch superfamily enzyme
MSKPVSVHDGPFSTNSLPSKLLLVPYITIIWISLIPLFFEIYFYIWIFTNILFFYLSLPFFILFAYFSLFFTSLGISKMFLLIIQKIHPPKEGIFRREKSNKDYYYWCYRSILKKWTIWLSKFIPSQLFDIIILKIYGVKIDFSTTIKDVTIDTEFIEIGKNSSIGPNSYVRSSMIFGHFLIIKSITIKKNVTIGSRVYISPGTIVNENVIVTSYSLTKYCQKLKKDSIYSGYPALKINLNSESKEIFDKSRIKGLFKEEIEYDYKKTEKKIPMESGSKFIKNIPLYLVIFFSIYIFSYSIPLYTLFSFNIHLFFPSLFSIQNIFTIFLNLKFLLIIFFTPILYILLYLLHLSLTILIVKIIYIILNRKEPKFKEGTFHWSEKDKGYIYYFIHSFLMRLVKWKIQRSIFPWLIKFCLSWIGRCKIGKNTILEDMYIAKDYLEIGNNCYIGKTLLTNHLWGENLFVKRIKINDNVVILDGSTISPGSFIDSNVNILPLSFTLKSEDLSKKSRYYDIPLNQISEEDLMKKFNLALNETDGDTKNE